MEATIMSASVAQPPIDDESSDDEQITMVKSGKRRCNISDSDDDDKHTELVSESVPNCENIQRSEDSDSEHDENPDDSTHVRDYSARIQNWKNKLSEKFNKTNFHSQKHDSNRNEKEHASVVDENEVVQPNFMQSKISELYDNESSDDAENTQIDREENACTQNIQLEHRHVNEKMKPSQTLSAKQAMNQMQKIKSESCRMLREKRFHLPYHKPKPVSLKDVISKKKIQFIPGAKKLNIRMNDEELRKFAKQLEEKEREMAELCKSESDEDSDLEKDTINNKHTSRTDEQVHTDSQFQHTFEIGLNNVEIPHTDILVIENDGSDDINNKQNHLNIAPENSDTRSTTDLIEESTQISERNNQMEEPVLHIEDENTVENETTKNKEDEEQLLEGDNNTQNVSGMSESQANDTKKGFHLLDIIPSSLPEKPTLSGAPGSLIDFLPNNEPTGVDKLREKYFLHAGIKSQEELDRIQENKVPAHIKFKRELEEQICKQKLEEWTKRNIDELSLKEKNKQSDDELSECEELLQKDDTLTGGNKGDSNEEESEPENSEDDENEEEEDDDDIISEKRKPKCDYIDDEAESDDDCVDSQDEDVEKDELSYNFKSVGDKNSTQKKVSRIYKPFRDSDSSDDENDDMKKNASQKLNSEESEILKNNVLCTPKSNASQKSETPDIFKSQDNRRINESFSLDSDDFLPLGQKYALSNTTPSTDPKNNYNATPKVQIGRPDLASFISPLGKLTPLQNYKPVDNSLSSASPSTSHNLNPEISSSDKWANLQKKLFSDTECSDTIQDTQEIADLCSGKFVDLTHENVTLPATVLQNSTSIDIEMTQNTENELLELCSGEFIEHKSTQNTQKKINDQYSENISQLKSKKESAEDSNAFTQVPEKTSLPNNSSLINMKTVDYMENKRTSPEKSVSMMKKDNTIRSYFMMASTKNKKQISNVKPVNEDDKLKQLVMSSVRNKISSSSSDDNDHLKPEPMRNKVLKSKRERNKRKVMTLEISDDEESESDGNSSSNFPPLNEDSNNSDKENLELNDEEEVEYDSEENEVKKTEIKETDKVASAFFENEAELTSEDEWKGSGDEDERGLDAFEWEEGDADQIDERKVSKELEKIHRHQMLDQDNREIKLLQNILLEDGDLQGGTRERKFRWKNVDNGIESGALVNDDNQDEELDELQSEEQWRKQRHERETFLKELMEKEKSKKDSQNSEVCISPRITFETSLVIKSTIETSVTIMSESLVYESNNKIIDKCDKKQTNENVLTKKNNDIPSPIKKPLFFTQNTFKGSFLSRSQAALNRLATISGGVDLTKAGNNAPSNLKSLAPGKKTFVFTSISPSCDNHENEDSKKMKRKNTSSSSTLAVKKPKISNENTTKYKKSLFDHIDID